MFRSRLDRLTRVENELAVFKRNTINLTQSMQVDIQTLKFKDIAHKRAIAELEAENKRLKARFTKLKTTHQLTHLNTETIGEKLPTDEAEEYSKRVQEIQTGSRSTHEYRGVQPEQGKTGLKF